ncbi:Hypothetical protein CINCED_3A025243 [Cinara cedri]|uniref:Uncharacterized protein n=1 Tax=Cinara cedri TaxID=506608 RepID=A0A5E4NI45_9HEMI|nr:Hypothetical protein CINCED_3A025243 [Cinara cedri]
MGLIEAHDKHLNLNREFVKILEGTAISGAISANEVKQGFFVRAGEFQIPEVIHAYQNPQEEEKKGNDEQWQNLAKQQQKQKISRRRQGGK